MTRTMRIRVVICALCAGLTLGLVAQGAEYLVSKQGSDANDGKSRETAFLTIQKGVSALTPGDTLTIGPGEYFETVERSDLGSLDVDTVIRAEIPGTAVMRGDVDLPEFEKVTGYRFVYAVAVDEKPLGVLEHDTLTALAKRPGIPDVEYEPGTWCYDAAQEKLYISSSNLRAPTGRRYTRSLNREHGIYLRDAKRVVIDGLAIGGLYPGWSIVLDPGRSCTVRDCIFYLGEGGVCLEGGGSNNVIENCESYGHTFGGIVLYSGNNETVRNCRTYETKREGDEHFGIMHYHGMNGPLLFKDNISWGQRFDFSVKPAGQDRLENCVALGSVRNANMFNNLIGGGNEYDADSTKASPDNVLFLREKYLDQDFEFADPLNLDFRLQPDSRFCGTGPDGTDRGVCQYEANVFYLSPAGDDGDDGLSMRKPWRTLERALKGLRPGDTLYLSEGTYTATPLQKTGDGESPIKICGRGRGQVVIEGGMELAGGAGIVFERLNFVDGAALDNSNDITFENCTFNGLIAEDVQGLKVTHALFTGGFLGLASSTDIYLSGNVYANGKGPAVVLRGKNEVLYSDYNSYSHAGRCWQVNNRTLALEEVRKNHDRYSKVLKPDLALTDRVPQLENGHVFAARGPHSTALGVHHAYDAESKPLELVGPVLHSVSDTTANIEWWTSRPATYDLTWGETPEMENRVETVRAPDRFTTYSLTGLKPGTKYYFRIESADTTGRGTTFFNTVLKPENASLTFKTLAVASKPAVYYVAPDGDDANSGLSREQAWRSVNHAAAMVNPGDTVLIAGGDYNETVRIRATGDKERPITFRCAPGEKVIFHGGGFREAFKVVVKKDIRFDGFYFADFGDSMGQVFGLWEGDRTQITRCFNFTGTGNVALIEATFSADVLVKNCVTANGFSSARMYVCPGFRIENNVFLRPWISGLTFVNKPDQKGCFSRNIVTDNLSRKVRVPLLTIGRFESLVDKDNCYFLRVPDEQRRMFFFYGTAAYGRHTRLGITADFEKPPVIVDHPDGTENNPRMSLKEYQGMVGDTGSYVGNPELVCVAGKTPTGHGQVFDAVVGAADLDFSDLFATDPKAIEKGIGLQPEAFKDFWFNKKQ